MTNSGLNTTLTRRRILEVSPLYRLHGWNSPEEMKAFWNRYPYLENNEELFHEAWSELVNWYSLEAQEIGEVRAFWGLVYRLLDDATEGDIDWIKIWLLSYLSAGGDIEFPEWMDGF